MVVGSLSLDLISILLIHISIDSMNHNNNADLAAPNRFDDVKGFEDEFKMIQNLKVFHYTLVLSATDDFSPENKLGQGGFGPVYKVI